MKPDLAPARSSEAVTVEVDGETLIYHRQTGRVHRLNPVGAIVWQWLDGETTVGALVSDLSSAFGIDPTVVRRDVTELLDILGQPFLSAEGPRSSGPVNEPRVLTNPPSP